jgi:diacylglycerol kinase (ATP)
MSAESESAYVIANPQAGRIRHKKPLGHGPRGAACTWQETRSEGHAESLAYEASVRGFRWIIAAGGDGTIHEVLNGMLRNPKNQSILGLIPAGTANDYAAAFTGNQYPSPAAAMRVDIGCLRWEDGLRYFANVAGLGFSAEIACRARRMVRIPARMRYTMALVRQLGPGYGPRFISLALDDGPAIETNTLLVSIAVGKREGSYPLHPNADLTDGLFDFLRLGRLSRRELAWHFPAMLRGVLPQNHPQVHQTRCRCVRMAASQPIPIHLDGESPKGASVDALSQISLEIIPQAIEVEWMMPYPR